MQDHMLPAGGFSEWLAGMERALRGATESEVACGSCTACCTSSQFIHIDPDEVETRARIPAELQFPAPQLPPGHVVLPYDEHGHCPMLVDDVCSIYEHRPRTCRTYDCRVFPAAGVEITDDAQKSIAHRAARWRFEHATPNDEAQHAAVRAAAKFVRDEPGRLPQGAAPSNATQHAVLAIRLHDAFLGGHDPNPGRLRALLAPEPPPEAPRH